MEHRNGTRSNRKHFELTVVSTKLLVNCVPKRCSARSPHRIRREKTSCTNCSHSHANEKSEEVKRGNVQPKLISNVIDAHTFSTRFYVCWRVSSVHSMLSHNFRTTSVQPHTIFSSVVVIFRVFPFRFFSLSSTTRLVLRTCVRSVCSKKCGATFEAKQCVNTVEFYPLFWISKTATATNVGCHVSWCRWTPVRHSIHSKSCN